MSKAAWTTLGLSFTFTTSLIYLVHRQQRVEKQAMRAGIEAEDEKRRKESFNVDVVEDEEEGRRKKRLEKNQKEFELQQKMTEELLKS